MAHVYSAEVRIDAPPEAVWAVLADLDGYPAWNPFTPEVRSDLRVGGKVRMRVVMGPGKVVRQTETLREVSPPRRLVWALDRPPAWLLRAERVQTVHADGAGTRYETVDTIAGLLAPFVHLRYGRALERGFAAMAAALKARAEARAA